MNLWQQFVAVVRATPAFYADRFDRRVFRQHEPENGAQDGQPPEPWCFHPSHWRPVPYPCSQASDAMSRISARMLDRLDKSDHHD